MLPNDLKILIKNSIWTAHVWSSGGFSLGVLVSVIRKRDLEGIQRHKPEEVVSLRKGFSPVIQLFCFICVSCYQPQFWKDRVDYPQKNRETAKSKFYINYILHTTLVHV